jgi:hypothetical protein
LRPPDPTPPFTTPPLLEAARPVVPELELPCVAPVLPALVLLLEPVEPTLTVSQWPFTAQVTLPVPQYPGLSLQFGMQLPVGPHTSVVPPLGLQAASYAGEGLPVQGVHFPAAVVVELPPVPLPPVLLPLPVVPPLPPPLPGAGVQMPATQLPTQQSLGPLQAEPMPASSLSGMQLRQSVERSQPTGQVTWHLPDDDPPQLPSPTAAPSAATPTAGTNTFQKPLPWGCVMRPNGARAGS